MAWTRKNFEVTTDLSRFDMDFVATSLQALWRKGSAREKIETAFANSLSFGLFDGKKQIGFARSVSDRTFVSWVCDMFIMPEYRGKHLGKWLMDCMRNHPDLVNTRLVFSSVPESQAFYERIGFLPMERGYSMMPLPDEHSDPPAPEAPAHQTEIAH